MQANDNKPKIVVTVWPGPRYDAETIRRIIAGYFRAGE